MGTHCYITLPMKDDQANHRQHLIDTILNYLGEHHDSSRLYEMLHEEMGFSNEDIMDLGFDLSEHWVYEWKSEDIQRRYAERLDSILPQHDVFTTTAWIEFAEDMAEGTDTSFESEAELLIAAFKEISECHSPQAVAKVYATVHVPGNALLANEIIAAAKYAEQGMSVQELSDMASRGEFEGEPYPERPSTDEENIGGMSELTSM